MVILNLFPVSAGGGLQNALSFMRVLSEQKKDVGFEYILLCRKGSEIEEAAKELNIKYSAFVGGTLGRVCFELWRGRQIAKKYNAKCIFSLFGNAPLTATNTITISGFAYSNIIQKEIDFWGWLPWHQRLKKYLIDFFRYWMAYRSDIIILETDYLYARAKEDVFRGKDLRVVKMAPSRVVVDALSFISSTDDSSLPIESNVFDILYLSGAHPNKRIHLLAPLFKELVGYDKKYRLVTTLPNGAYLQSIVDAFYNNGISAHHVNIGSVPSGRVADVLRTVKAVMNMAKLESFSNNWVEAWAARLPLLVTDAAWAKASCSEAAIYVDIDNPSVSAKSIHSSLSSNKVVYELIESGRKMLSELPSAEQRVGQYFEIIKSCDKEI